VIVDKVLRVLWKFEIEKINDHLPRAYKTLEELLKEDSPNIVARDGSHYSLDRDEIRKLAEFVPDRFHKMLRLPFVVVRRLDLGKGVFTIAGGKLEQFTIHKLLGNTELPFSRYMDADLPPYIYWPHVAELRRKFRTLVVIGFGVAKEDISEARSILWPSRPQRFGRSGFV